MTETSENDHTTTPTLPEDRDLLLARIVTIFNHARSSTVGITLTVSGLVVTGTLVSGAKYFETLTEAAGGPRGISRIWEAEVEHYRQMADGTGEYDLAAELARTGYIHLIDASVQEGVQRIGINAWRGRLTEVSGWSLGTLHAGELDDD